MILFGPKKNLAFFVVCMTFSAMLMNAVLLLTRGVCARARAADVEIWSVDGRTARSTVPINGRRPCNITSAGPARSAMRVA